MPQPCQKHCTSPSRATVILVRERKTSWALMLSEDVLTLRRASFWAPWPLAGISGVPLLLQASLFASPSVPGRGSRWARPPPKQGVGKLRGVKPHHRAEGRGAALAISLRQHEDSPQLLADQQELRALLSISSSPSLSYREGLMVSDREGDSWPSCHRE